MDGLVLRRVNKMIIPKQPQSHNNQFQNKPKPYIAAQLFMARDIQASSVGMSHTLVSCTQSEHTFHRPSIGRSEHIFQIDRCRSFLWCCVVVLLLAYRRWTEAWQAIPFACQRQQVRGPGAGWTALHLVAQRPSPEWLQAEVVTATPDSLLDTRTVRDAYISKPCIKRNTQIQQRRSNPSTAVVL